MGLGSIALRNQTSVKKVLPDNKDADPKERVLSAVPSGLHEVDCSGSFSRESLRGLQIDESDFELRSRCDHGHRTGNMASCDQQLTKDLGRILNTASNKLHDQQSTPNTTGRSNSSAPDNVPPNETEIAVARPEYVHCPNAQACQTDVDDANVYQVNRRTQWPSTWSSQLTSYQMDSIGQAFHEPVSSNLIGPIGLDPDKSAHSSFALDADLAAQAVSSNNLHSIQSSLPNSTVAFNTTTQPPSLQTQAPASILVADSPTDTDSAYNDETQSYTTSLKSSVTKFEYENGRRYHAGDGSSWHFLPNDDEEMDRLDLFHHIMHLRCDERLHLAPLQSCPQRILDLGTGTGIWAVMMGELYDSASVLGNDLSPIQPILVPPNVSFEVDDMEKEWCYSTSFDYIHCRYLAGAIRDWPRLMRQAYE